MKRHVCSIFLLTFICILFTSCSRTNTNVIDLTSNKLVEAYDYQSSDAIADNVEVEKMKISTPSNSQVNTFCVFDKMVYYAVEFSDFLENSTGQSTIKFEDKYNTQIRSYNMESKEDTLIYKYDEEVCVGVTDIQCNGSELVWEEYIGNDAWNVKNLSLNKDPTDKNPKNIISYDSEEGKLSSVTLTITEASLYWYEQKNESNNPIILCRYDFKTKETTIEKTGLTLESPYEHAGIINGICTTYEKEKDNSTIIQVYDSKKKEEIDLHVTTDVITPISNGEICVWMTGYDYDDRTEIFVYDLSEQKLEQIHVPYAFSYGIVNNHVLVNQGDNLYCYDVKKKEYKKLTKTENTTYGYTFQGLSENIYAESIEDTNNLVIVNIKEK